MLDVKKIYFIDFKRYLHEFFTGIEILFFKSPSDLKIDSQNRSDTYGPPCIFFFNLQRPKNEAFNIVRTEYNPCENQFV